MINNTEYKNVEKLYNKFINDGEKLNLRSFSSDVIEDDVNEWLNYVIDKIY